MTVEQRGCTFCDVCRRLALALVVILIMCGTLLLENENHLNSPNPRTVLFRVNNKLILLNKSDVAATKDFLAKKQFSTKSTAPPAPPFNYLRTKQWGKQDRLAWTMYYGDFSCHENHRRQTMIAILRTWFKLVKEYKVEFAFYFGSLLGIVRDNDVIPWDHDMDILVPYRDILKLEKVGWPRTNPKAWNGRTFINYIPNSQHNISIDDRKRWDCNGKPAASHVDHCAIQEPLVRLYNNGVFLDVFSFWTTKDTCEFVTEGRHHVIKKQNYYPLRQCVFMGFDGWCPNDPGQLLIDNYGKDYKTPIKRCKSGHWV